MQTIKNYSDNALAIREAKTVQELFIALKQSSKAEYLEAVSNKPLRLIRILWQKTNLVGILLEDINQLMVELKRLLNDIESSKNDPDTYCQQIQSCLLQLKEMITSLQQFLSKDTALLAVIKTHRTPSKFGPTKSYTKIMETLWEAATNFLCIYAHSNDKSLHFQLRQLYLKLKLHGQTAYDIGARTLRMKVLATFINKGDYESAIDFYFFMYPNNTNFYIAHTIMCMGTENYFDIFDDIRATFSCHVNWGLLIQTSVNKLDNAEPGSIPDALRNELENKEPYARLVQEYRAIPVAQVAATNSQRFYEYEKSDLVTAVAANKRSVITC